MWTCSCFSPVNRSYSHFSSAIYRNVRVYSTSINSWQEGISILNIMYIIKHVEMWMLDVGIILWIENMNKSTYHLFLTVVSTVIIIIIIVPLEVEVLKTDKLTKRKNETKNDEMRSKNIEQQNLHSNLIRLCSILIIMVEIFVS